MIATAAFEIQIGPIDSLVFYARNPRKNDFKVPVLAHSDGEVVDGHLRIKARKLRIDQIPVVLCDEWTPAQVKGIPLDGESLRELGVLGRRAIGPRTPGV